MAPRTGLPRAVRRLLAFSTAVALVTTVVVAVPAGKHLVHAAGVAQTVYEVVFYLGAFSMIGVIVMRARSAREGRTGWLLLSLGPVSFLCGSTVFQTLAAGQPSPNLADLFFLAVYPLTFAGLVLLFRRQAGRTPAALWLDGLVGGLGVGSLGARYVLQPVMHVGPGSAAAVTTTLAYPVCDLVLLIMIVSMIGILRHDAGPQWFFLLAGYVVLAGTDSVFLIQTSLGTYETPSLLDHGWQVAFMLVAYAGWNRPGRGQSKRNVSSLSVVPVASALAATVVLVDSTGTTQPLPTLLAAGTVVLTLVRLAVTIRETTRLAHTDRLARTDELTGLANRRAFYERARVLSSEHAATGAQHAVLLVDLDRFKEVNDSFGHLVGDDLLRLVGPRLAAQCGPGDLIARLGGDEFGIVVTGSLDGETVAARLTRSLEQPFVLRDLTVQISASVGIAHFPEDGTDGATLLQRADVAMYVAKRTRTGWRAYDAAEDPNSPERLYLLDALRGVLADGGRGLELHYQPKLGLGDGRLTGVEALVRWRHPQLGLLPPAAFLPLMEEYGLSRQLTEVVLREGVAQCARWRAQGLHMPVAVNLPPALCSDPALPSYVREVLDAHRLPATFLELEITEEFLLGDLDGARRVLRELSDLGVRVSIDDFGTGYSSLAYLRDLPVVQLKLDRTFVTGMEDDTTTAALVRSTVSLSHSLGLEMVAEGVETAAALDLLREVGCDQAQGFHIGRPVPAAEITEWLLAGGDADEESKTA